VRLAPSATAFAYALAALVIVVAGAASQARAQDAPPPPPPVPEGTVITATVAPTGIVGDAIVPPAGYEMLAAEPPPPPTGYGAFSLAPAPGVPAPPPPAPSGDRTLRILAESGAWLLATVATVGVSALVANSTDVASDPSPLLLTFLSGYFVLMPVAAWLGGNAVDGKGALGWTIFGHALFGLIGAVVAYEVSHDGAVAAARNALTANLRTARPPGLTFTFSF
jgi:hypothetical protein